MPRQTFFNLPPDKRSRVLAALKAEFAAHSFTQGSVDRITTQAGVAKGSFYQYFEDKRDAYAHLVDELMGSRLALVGTPVPQASLEQVLTGLVYASHDFRARDPLGWAVLARAYAEDSPLDPASGASSAALHQWAVAAIQAGQDSGELRADVEPETAAWFIERVLTGLPEHVMSRFGVTAETIAAQGSAFDAPEIERVGADAIAMIVRALAPEQP